MVLIPSFIIEMSAKYNEATKDVEIIMISDVWYSFFYLLIDVDPVLFYVNFIRTC